MSIETRQLGRKAHDIASIFAFTALSTLPALAFFACAQRRIVSGLSGLSGSISG